jgi:hypothetical protein
MYKWLKEPFIPNIEHSIIIHFPEIQKDIYIKTLCYGLAGNNEQIIISENKERLKNKKNDYIFYTSEVFYKQKGIDTLEIYVAKSAISEPQNSFKNINVMLKGLVTSSDIQDYNMNYKKYGLKKISIYGEEAVTNSIKSKQHNKKK